jgi:hypothetical protein
MSHIFLNLRRSSTRVCALTVALWLFPAVAAAEDPARTNLELMTDLTSEVVNELLPHFAARLEGRAVYLKKYTVNEHYQFMNTVMARLFTDAGITTYPNAAPTDGTPVVTLEYQALEYDLAYTKVYRSYLIGGKKVARKADVTILASVYDEQGALVWTREAKRDYEDNFNYGDIDRIEEGNFQFTRPALPGGGWGKYAEPVLVTGIVVGLIYLFFSNQSDS